MNITINSPLINVIKFLKNLVKKLNEYNYSASILEQYIHNEAFEVVIAVNDSNCSLYIDKNGVQLDDIDYIKSSVINTIRESIEIIDKEFATN